MPAVIPAIIGFAATSGGGALLAGGATAAAAIAGSKMSSNAAKNAAATQAKASTQIADTQTQAANHAADLQSQATADALAFQKAQAENAYQNNEVTRRGNYDQWRAREANINTIGAMLGLPSRNVPDYVPGVDPQLTPSVGQVAGKAPTAVPNGDYQAYFNSLTGGRPMDQNDLLALKPQLDAAGIQITPPNKTQGAISKIGLPDGTWVRVLNGDTFQKNPTVWIPQPAGGGNSVGSLLGGYQPYVAPTLTRYQPQIAQGAVMPNIGAFL